jgi:hypothetical protein
MELEMDVPQVKPYAGLDSVTRLGLPVDVCAERIGRFGFVSQQLMRVQAGQMAAIANWDLKAALARQLWESAQHWGLWRDRIAELRGHEHLIQRHAEGKLNDVFVELLANASDLEFAVGLYAVILPAYQAVLQRYVQESNPLVDYITLRLARQVLLDVDAWLAFGESALAALGGGTAPALAWQSHLERYLAAAGGIDGSQAEQPSFDLPRPRASQEFRLPTAFARDQRFRTTIPKVNPFPAGDVQNELLRKMWVRSQEMTAAEMCATVLYEWEELPYEGQVDLARHCWDETRHALFGQAALEAEGHPLESLPNWVGYAGHTLPAAPPKRYAHLALATEAGSMKYPGGKRGEWEWCRDSARHPLMTLFQDFDWADEVNHVHYGRKWLVQFFFHGNRAQAQAVADETRAERAAYYEQYARDSQDPSAADSAHSGY